ncbi:auxin-responsive protein SAUR32-like [Abrus precatorius]|uniref:Auxin-responsive protein SAUR32-like n=1 Tax=Abrus precatorius TaxID=3816 RepID=A0A8B8LDF7_ABRPR|nr:auxin-responsive protein SAUR32-like [Abrus precatorius]
MLGKSSKQIAVTYHHGREVVTKDIPKGCLAIKVGQGEEQQRITVPVNYLNHPLFAQLLKEAEEEYGFAQQGTIIIPCQVAQFKNVQHLIDRERSLHHHHLVGCFRA